MKLLIMCEGPNELEIIRILLENDCFKFTSDDLLGLVPYHARQITTSKAVTLALSIYIGPVKVLRIGDNQTDKLKLPPDYKDRIVGIEKYCTKPELEMLLIIAEQLESEYEKVKSSMKPKVFSKQNIQYGRECYDNSTKFYRSYFGDRCDVLVNCLKTYKQTRGSHKKDELYLADLLK